MLPIDPGLRDQFVEDLLAGFDLGAAPQADARQQLLAIVCHDLRNPLATITGSIGLLRRQALSASGQAALDRMERSAARMAKLIGDLLDYSRVREEGAISLKRRPVDLHAVCRDSVEECRAAHPGKTILLETLGGGAASVDPDRVEQALTNLIVNAVQHGGDGPVRVQSIATAAHALEIKVHNAGAAIPQDMLPDLFRPFHHHAPGGLGLGLFIVAQVAAAHGGRAWAESSSEAGTTFTIELPRS